VPSLPDRPYGGRRILPFLLVLDSLQRAATA
jgi:hypothetical protein